MNCLEFRRRCIAEPDCQKSDFLRHRAECHGCQQLVREMERFESELSSAIRVDTPSELASRIMLRQSMLLERSRRRLNYLFYGLVAGIVLLAGLVLGFLLQQGPSLDQAVINYVTHHHQENRQTTGVTPVKSDQLKALFRSFDLELKSDLGEVLLAEPCDIKQSKGLHVVIKGEKGPINLIVMPDNPYDKETTVTNDYFTGIIAPCPRGSMALLGVPGESLESLRQQLREEVIWL